LVRAREGTNKNKKVKKAAGAARPEVGVGGANVRTNPSHHAQGYPCDRKEMRKKSLAARWGDRGKPRQIQGEKLVGVQKTRKSGGRVSARSGGDRGKKRGCGKGRSGAPVSAGHTTRVSEKKKKTRRKRLLKTIRSEKRGKPSPERGGAQKKKTQLDWEHLRVKMAARVMTGDTKLETGMEWDPGGSRVWKRGLPSGAKMLGVRLGGKILASGELRDGRLRG